MFLLGHLGIGLGLAWLLSWKSPARIDYRLVLFGAILPDLIDKPLAYVTGLDSRIWTHTFLFLFAILALSFVPMFRALRLVGFGVATHLLLDMIWIQPAVVWYPAYGWSFPMAPFNPGRWLTRCSTTPTSRPARSSGLSAWSPSRGSTGSVRGRRYANSWSTAFSPERRRSQP